MFGKYFLLPILVLIVCHASDVAANDCDEEKTSTEDKLAKKLFCGNYDNTQRPVKSHNTSIKIAMSLHIRNYDVYEHKQSLLLDAWITYRWRDELLTWDRSEYELDELDVPPSKIWQPKIVGVNDKNLANSDSSCSNEKCVVQLNGEVSCTPLCNYEVHCDSTIEDWPFDKLNCTLNMGSWLEGTEAFHIGGESNITTDFMDVHHTEWKLLSAEIQNDEVMEKNHFPIVKYFFFLERHRSVFAAVLTPGFLLVAINMVVLWMNYESIDRLHILCVTCMGHFSFFEYLYWNMPRTGDNVPKLLIFFRDSFIINMLILVMTVVLRHNGPGMGTSERMVNKLAFRVASTGLGRVILQVDDDPDDINGSKTPDERVNGNQPEYVNGDTVNLVVEDPNNTASIARMRRLEHHRAKVVVTFIDRIILVCCLISYTFMIFSTLPEETI